MCAPADVLKLTFHMCLLLTFLPLSEPSIFGLFNSTDNSYSVVDSRNSEVLMRGSKIALFEEGKWFSDGDGLRRISTRPKKISVTDAAFGYCSGVQLDWVRTNESGIIMSTALLNCSDTSSIMFEVSFPKGLKKTNHVNVHDDSKSDVIFNFPAMATPFSSRLKHVLSWKDAFVQPSLNRTFGYSGSGPSVFYDEPRAYFDGASRYKMGTVIVVSPLNNFKSTGETDLLFDGNKGAWVPGISSIVAEVPSNFVQRYIVFMGEPKVGLTGTLYQWGNLMQLRASHILNHSNINNTKTSPNKEFMRKVEDITLSKLSYTTDNGAQLCFCNENCDTKLLKVVESLSVDCPSLGSISFQGG